MLATVMKYALPIIVFLAARYLVGLSLLWAVLLTVAVWYFTMKTTAAPAAA